MCSLLFFISRCPKESLSSLDMLLGEITWLYCNYVVSTVVQLLKENYTDQGLGCQDRRFVSSGRYTKGGYPIFLLNNRNDLNNLPSGIYQKSWCLQLCHPSPTPVARRICPNQQSIVCSRMNRTHGSSEFCWWNCSLLQRIGEKFSYDYRTRSILLLWVAWDLCKYRTLERRQGKTRSHQGDRQFLWVFCWTIP